MASDSLVLFDIDGTLLRGAGPHHKDALLAGIRLVTGVTCSFDGIDTSGQLDRDLITLLMTRAGVSGRTAARSLSQIMKESRACYQRDCAVDLRVKVLPGVFDTLRRLQEHRIPAGLVTGNLESIAWRKMELAGLREFFPIGAFAEDGRTRARLAQVASWRAVKRGLVKRKAMVALIGDHANDIGAAKANGFRAIAVATGMMPMDRLKEHEPDFVLKDMTELDMNSLFVTARR